MTREYYCAVCDRTYLSRDEHARILQQQEAVEPFCACSPGDACSCAYDCECRLRNEHLYSEDEGYRNVGARVLKAREEANSGN